jgi:hypothetical protein
VRRHPRAKEAAHRADAEDREVHGGSPHYISDIL